MNESNTALSQFLRPRRIPLVQTLEELWQRGEQPDLVAFLQTHAPTDLNEMAAVLACDQWRRWHAGQRVSAEEYLERFPALESETDAALQVIYGEFLVRRELGEQPAATEYLGRFASFADLLAEQFTLLQTAPPIAPAPDSWQTENGVNGRQDPDKGVATIDPYATKADASVVDPYLTQAEAGPSLPVAPFPEELSPRGYEILGKLGQGAMGVVYKARQRALNRVVALKMIKGERGVGEDLRKEAEAVARLQHPNIVQVFEVGEVDGQAFFSQEFVDGGSLDKHLHGEPQEGRKAALDVEVLARAIHVAHQHRIVHRDLKPANILRTRDGVLKIGDFGLAKQLDEEAQINTQSIKGTPCYMAPEQAEAGQITAATDVYALGAILYEMLTGRPPFKGKDVWETLEQVRQQEPVAPRQLQPKAPRDLETICLKCLRKEPAKRYVSAESLAEDLHRFLNNEPIQARPVSAWERLRKWARRKPAAASLMVAAVLLAAVSVGSIVLYALYESQQADLFKQAFEQTTKEEQGRERIRQYLDQARQHEQDGDWNAANAELQKAEEALKSQINPHADELRARARQQLKGIAQKLKEQERGQQAKERLERLKTPHFQTFFYETMFTGMDRADSRAKARAAADAGLAIHSTQGGNLLDLLEQDLPFLNPAERSWLTNACYELLLIRAGIEAEEGHEASALTMLTRADKLGPQTRTHYLLQTRCLALSKGEPFDRAEAEKKAPPPAGRLDWFFTGLEHYRTGLDTGREEPLVEAIIACGKALQHQTDDFWARYVTGLAQLRLGRWADAKTNLAVCVNQKRDFSWPRLLHGFAASEKGFGHLQAQRAAERRLMKKDKSLVAEFLGAKTEEKLASVEFSAAEDDFGAALKQDLDPLAQYVGLVNRGVLFVRQERWDAAVVDLERAVKLNPKFFQGHINLAQALQGSGRPIEALAAMNEAVAKASNLPIAYESRANLHLEQKNRDGARDDFKKAISLEPKDARSTRLINNLLKLGELLYKAEEYEEALRYYETARQLRPEFMATQRYWFETLLALERYAEAGQALDIYLKATVPAPAEIYHARGLLHARKGETGAAIDMYTLALWRDPADFSARCRRGWAYLLNGAPRFALEDFETCLNEDRTNADALLGRGNARMGLKQLDKALEDAQAAEKQGKLTDRLTYNLGRIYGQAAEQLEADPRRNVDAKIPRRALYCKEKALECLRETLVLLKTEERKTKLWRTEVQADPAFNALRFWLPFEKMQARYGEKR